MADTSMLTRREAEVMSIIWEGGSATVKEARSHELIEDGTPYTSVLSIFQTLEQKGWIRHEREGRAYRYYPLTTRREAAERALTEVRDRYAGLTDTGDEEVRAAAVEVFDL